MKLLSIFYFCQMTGPPISPLTPQIILLHPLLAPQSSPLSPQFSIRPCFSNVMQRLPLSPSLSDSSSLPLCYYVVVLVASLCFSLYLWISLLLSIALKFNLCISISHGSSLTGTPIALRDTRSPFYLHTQIHTHTHKHAQTFKPLSFILLPSFYDYSLPFSTLNPFILSVSHSLLIFLPLVPQAISLLKWLSLQI